METNRKYIIIGLVALILALGSVLGYMVMFHVDYERVNISSATTMEVPKAADSSWSEHNGIKEFTCPSKKVIVKAINSAENFTRENGKAFLSVRDSLIKNATSIESYNGYDIVQKKVNGTDYYIVSISNKTSHDNILILSENLDVLKHMIDSIKFGKPTLQANLTADAPVSGGTSNANDSDDISEDDLMLAMGLAYYYGYYEGYGDSYNDYYDSYYDYYDYYSDDYDYYYDDSGYDYYDDYSSDQGYEGGSSDSGQDSYQDY